MNQFLWFKLSNGPIPACASSIRPNCRLKKLTSPARPTSKLRMRSATWWSVARLLSGLQQPWESRSGLRAPKRKRIHVNADETRPFLQGSRLTAWELMKDGIPTTVISDNMAGAMMKQGKIGAIVVGADRIAANGDVANKIGTYMLAVLAKEHGIPFYVAAPFSTVDLDTPDGSRIPIEQRNPREVTHIAGKQMVPDGTEVENPAFDVTPAKYVSAIVTEKGIARAPYGGSLRKLSEDVAVLQQ